MENNKFKKLIKLLFPPLWLTILLVIFSATALTIVFVKKMQYSFFAYVIYAVSFYTLVVACLACYYDLPKIIKTFKVKINNNKFGKRYFSDPAFQTRVNLYRSLSINLLYVCFNLFLGIFYKTAWFIIFAIYYLIMAVMRYVLVRYFSKDEIGENRKKELNCSRLCSYILITVNLTLTGAVLMMVYLNKGFSYPHILIYVMALYTFYITTSAIIKVIKYKKYKSPVMSMTKAINLAASLFSMLSLETAMLSQFGSESSLFFKKTMIILTGAGISAIVVFISVYFIIKTTKELKFLKQNSKGALHNGQK